MTFDKVPYGVNLSTDVYNSYKCWRQQSEGTPGCKGVFERAGKEVLVSFGHVINAALVAPIMMVYDFVMAAFFLAANVCTLFLMDELRERFVGHSYSMIMDGYEVLRNIVTALWPSAIYRAQDAINLEYLQEHMASIQRQLPGAVTQLMRVAARNNVEFMSNVNRDAFGDLLTGGNPFMSDALIAGLATRFGVTIPEE